MRSMRCAVMHLMRGCFVVAWESRLPYHTGVVLFKCVHSVMLQAVLVDTQPLISHDTKIASQMQFTESITLKLHTTTNTELIGATRETHIHTLKQC
jgi:hypothetical protein